MEKAWYSCNELSLCSHVLWQMDYYYFNSLLVVLIVQHWMALVYLCSLSLHAEVLFPCQVFMLNII